MSTWKIGKQDGHGDHIESFDSGGDLIGMTYWSAGKFTAWFSDMDDYAHTRLFQRTPTQLEIQHKEPLDNASTYHFIKKYDGMPWLLI